MKLSFKADKYYSDGYGGVNTKNKKISELDMVIQFKHGMRFHSNEGYDDQKEFLKKLNERVGSITNKIKFRKHILMMDIDYLDFKDEIRDTLIQQKIAHTVIESSENHFWIIADVIKKNDFEIAKMSKRYVNVDPKYIEYGISHGFQLRAFPRSGYAPEIVSRYGEGGDDYRAFIEAWEKYWNSPHIKWMVQEYLINAI
jgi:hypothetical protein